MRQKSLLFIFVLVCIISSAKAQTVVDIVVNSADHNTLETAVLAAGLAETLSGEGPFTVFAPTDAAFAAIDPDVLNSLLADPTGALTDILIYHVVSGVADGSNISDGLGIGALNGQTLRFSINDNGIFINDAMVTVADIKTDNGVVHVIDAVLLPRPTKTRVDGTVVDVVVNSPDHNTLETAVLAADLAGTLSGTGPFTVFAPTDAAFAAIDADVLNSLLADPGGALTTILLNHVTSGVADTDNISDGSRFSSLAGETLAVTANSDGIFINGAQVSVADIYTNNGVVHVIDAVMLPPTPTTILDIVVNSPDHTTLESLVIAAGLDDELSSAGPFTVFAPTDAAFAALPAEVVSALTADPTGALANVLLYHVVSGVATVGNISDGLAVGSLQGGNLTFTINDSGVAINGINVSVVDIKTDNGVVHVIDAVLVP